jgi:hypothetical protein
LLGIRHTIERPAARRLDDGLIGIAFLAALLLFLGQEARIAGAPGFPLDDSWIHLHLARNLAEGAGFAYNPGRPVAGSTAPLWTLLIAAGAAVGAPPLWIAKTLGVLLTFATGLVARRLALALSGERLLALLAGVGTVLLGRISWGALSGMEVGLAAFVTTGALLAHVRGKEAWCGFLLGLAILSRPEALLLVPLLLFARPLAVGRTLGLLAPVALLVTPAVVFSLATVGAPLPATAAAKVEGGVLGLMTGAFEGWVGALLSRPRDFMTEWARLLWRDHPALPFLIPIGFLALCRSHGRLLAWPGAILLLQPLGMAILAPYRGPAFQEGRYSTHLAPLAVVVLVVGLWSLVGQRRRLARWVVYTYLVIAALLLWPASQRYGWAVQNINAMQVHLGQWVRKNLPGNARLALNDVGAIAFVSRREVIDLMGLVTPEILPYRRQGEAGVLRYLEKVCPDYLIIFPDWFPDLARRRDRFTPLYRVKLEHNRVAGADLMVVFETAWSRWRIARQPCP